MEIGIIGSGRMGAAIGARWAKAGHEVMFGSRDAGKAQALAADIGLQARGGSYADAVQFADVLLLATPWRATQEVIASLPPLSGKILIETTNNLSGEGDDTATTEQVAAWAPEARVVKAFNTIFHTLLQGEPSAIRPTVFLCGADAEARRVVGELVTAAGFDPLDAGGLDQAHYLDTLARFIIYLARGQGLGTDISYVIAHV